MIEEYGTLSEEELIQEIMAELEENGEIDPSDLDDQLAGVYFNTEGPLSALANTARKDLRQSRKARIGYAIENPEFFDHPKLGKDFIAYDIRSLKEWAQAYGKWLTDATRAIQAHLKKASKLT